MVNCVRYAVRRFYGKGKHSKRRSNLPRALICRGKYHSVRRAAPLKIKESLIDPSISGDAKPAENTVTPGSPLSKNTTESIEKLIEMGRTLNLDPTPSEPFEFLKALDSLLQERRATAGNNPDLITKHYCDAAAILTECPVIPTVEKKFKQEFADAENLRCLRLKYGVPTIHFECSEWLAEHNCLALLREMLREHPTSPYNWYSICSSAIRTGSLDVLKWLHEEKKLTILDMYYPMSKAVYSGHLKTIQWLHSEFESQIDWSEVIASFRPVAPRAIRSKR
ncbi:hypothetical protein PSACC_01416 [Paramicrosporidium saccamoebae]|uniref:Uncharacterized protein n=1 Tax=Paramicrosporidium saccamoebae TaxID=1246581 RepID=A0A2H9TM02_9FUNG|nr:hypothetical protein PSACC_01416 [Paramicrosporidium saccamoebae]